MVIYIEADCPQCGMHWHHIRRECACGWVEAQPPPQPAASEAAVRAVLLDLLTAVDAYERALESVDMGGVECRSMDAYNARVAALEQAADALHAAQDAVRTWLAAHPEGGQDG